MYLNCHSYYSFKFGVLSVEELLALAAENGVTTLALTDINNTSGCLDFARLASKYNVKPVVGIDYRNGADCCYVGIAHNNEGFRELNEHLTDHLVNERKFAAIAPEFEHASIIYPFGIGNTIDHLSLIHI